MPAKFGSKPPMSIQVILSSLSNIYQFINSQCVLKCAGESDNDKMIDFCPAAGGGGVPRQAKHSYTTMSLLRQWKCVESVGEVGQ